MEDKLSSGTGSMVLVACHNLGHDDRVYIMHELNKSVSVDEGQGRTKTFLDFLCIWIDKE